MSAARQAFGVYRRAGRGWAGLWVPAALLPCAAFAELSNSSLLGPGLRSRPAYDGSATQRTELVPVIRWFGPLLFARSTQGVLEAGARTEIARGLHIGAQLAYEPGRQTRESPFLERPGAAARVRRPARCRAARRHAARLHAAGRHAAGRRHPGRRGLLYGTDYAVGDNFRGLWGLFGSYDYIAPQIFHVSTTALSLGTTGQWWATRNVALQGTVLAGLGYA